ncbi:preprotein translocase subunit TatC [Paenimyroides tangerinum]|uniref:Sec-independent protein translocase protein TatC n=1 Tax=Paenimyroides tangerinum TaxID=2488728 RepID=A0A3P3VXX6_9FLAO|nr:twin-arginine translocase subunit TatC [Paenimyroides tangerinum]RRJ87662.1 preprotein translocase subunit TatC [Paenimyroides tangerinum]
MNRKSIIKNLVDLRFFIFKSLIGVLISTILSLIFYRFIFEEIIFAPVNKNFITYKIYCQLVSSFRIDTTLCIEKFNFILQNRTMEGQLSVLIYTSITFGFILSFPWIIFQLLTYIKEKFSASKSINLKFQVLNISLLFIVGVIFGYYIIVPLSISFLTNVQISSIIKNQIDIGSYISLLRSTIIATGVIFNLPILVYYLNKLGIVNHDLLKHYRRYAYVIILIASAIITPPDVLSLILLVIPLFCLYEISTYLCKFNRTVNI